MKKTLSFALFDSGETILSALVFSTFFPLYITEYVDPKIYSLIYGGSFLLSFGLALQLGRIADSRGLRKQFFTLFGFAVVLLCASLWLSYANPVLSLLLFVLLTVSHQQSFVFYNSLLLGFEKRGLTSGIGVALGYVASALSLIFLARHLDGAEVYPVVALLFFLLLLPSLFFLKNPSQRSEVRLRDMFRDRRFLLLVLSLLSLTEVANTLTAMMGIYLREVYALSAVEIYRVIGFSALGGVAGGFLWGHLTDLFGPRWTFPAGFALWILFLLLLPLVPPKLILPVGFLAGLSLAHLWTTSRVLILSEFPEGEASVRLSFLSLTERIASTSGLTVWAIFLMLSNDNYRLSAALMVVFPLGGIGLYLLYLRERVRRSPPPS